MWAALGLGALSFAGSMMQGIGAAQSSKKQARLQMIADELNRQANEATLARVNARREEIGNTLLDVRNVVRTAEAAGINPISFMNAGGMSYMVDASKFLVPEYQLTSASQVPQQHSMLSAFGGALSAGATAFGTQYRADQSFALQQQKLNNAQDALFFGLSQSNAMRGAISFGSSGAGASARGASAAGGVSANPYWQRWKEEDVGVTNPGRYSHVDPGISNTQNKEDRAGEPGDWLFGLDTLVHDAVRNVSGRTISEWGKAAGVSLEQYRKGSNSIADALYRWYQDDKGFWGRSRAAYRGSVQPYAPFAGAYPDWATP